MKLVGEYGLRDIINALQGNFGCTNVTTSKSGAELSDKFYRLELFALSIELHYTESKRLEVYRIDESQNGKKGYVPLLTLRAE